MIKKRFISILALLCLTVSGAWAQEVTLLTTILSTGDNASFKSGSKTFDNKVTVTISGEVYNSDDYWGWNTESAGTLTVTAAQGYTITRVKFYSNNGATEGSAFDEEAPFEANLVYTDQKGPHAKVNGTSIGKYGVTKIEVYGYANPVTGVTLSPTTATLTVGETETLTAIVAPENAKDKSVTWTTSNASVATVANGVVTAVGAGTATITVTTTDGAFTATCTVTVTAPAGPEVTWDAATKQATFAMPAYDVELEVEYYPGMFTLGGDAIEGGTVEVVGLTGDALPAGFEKDAEGNIYVAKGTTFTVKATPEEGYHFVCWSDDENNTNPEREITMPADGTDLSLSATFAENEYDITFSEGTNPDPENPEWTATPNPAKTKQTVTVTYSGSKKVIGVKAEKKVPTLNLATVTEATTVEDGYTLTGELGAKVKISIADGATVTLDGVTINGVDNNSYKWAGITCLGDATIILSGTNTVKGFHHNYPGIYVPQNNTVTIQGSGSLTASSNAWGCGIGGGYQIACGNIVIAGGTINATGGNYAAGIGGGYQVSCGNISITGGTINATGGMSAAGIGSGYQGSCVTVTITDGVTSVTATKGNQANYSIGAGNSGSCGTVTIGCTLDGDGNPVGGTTGQISTSPYTYQPSN